jgi:osmoprotectant transport system substrate-binding protein
MAQHTSSARGTRRAAAVALVAAFTLGACGTGGDPLDSGGEEADSGTVVVGSADFPENILLAEMYAGVVEATGADVETKLSIGSREAYIPALEAGEINLIPEYTGNLLLHFDADAESTDPQEVYSDLESALPEDLTVLEASEAEDKDALVVTRETAQKHDLQTIADLEPVAGQLTMGGAAEFRERRAGLVGLKDVYGIEFEEFVSLDAGGALTKTALADGDIDVANLFSTDPTIATEGYLMLEDPENLFLAQQVVPLVAEDALTPEIEQALDDLSAALTTENLTEALSQVLVDKREPADVAQQFLEDNDLV